MSRGRVITVGEAEEYYAQRERALGETRQRRRQRVAITRTLSILFGALLFGGWWAQDAPYRQPLSINFHGEQAIAVVGLGLLIFGIGAWVGLHLPSEPSKRDERAVLGSD